MGLTKIPVTALHRVLVVNPRCDVLEPRPVRKEHRSTAAVGVDIKNNHTERGLPAAIVLLNWANSAGNFCDAKLPDIQWVELLRSNLLEVPALGTRLSAMQRPQKDLESNTSKEINQLCVFSGHVGEVAELQDGTEAVFGLVVSEGGNPRQHADGRDRRS